MTKEVEQILDNKYVWALCKITYPDESDMQKFVEGVIEAKDVKIYHKGKKYKVTQYFDTEYFEIIKEIENEHS